VTNTYVIDVGTNVITGLGKLGVFGAEKVKELFPIFVKNAVIDGYINLLAVLVSFFAAIYLFKKATNENIHDDHGKQMFFSIALVISCGMFIATTCSLFCVGFKEILNPKYVAIQDIIRIIK